MLKYICPEPSPGWGTSDLDRLRLCTPCYGSTGKTQIFQQLEAYRAYPDFNNYLAFLFATGDQLTVEVGADGEA